MSGCKVYLVPGFFGFTSLGALSYFHKVAETLQHALRERGCDAEVVRCPTQPTGSIPRRTARLCRHVVETGGLEADEIHFVGHSTGGLDARVLLSPQVHADRQGLEEQVSDRARSLITISTPHHGSPLATFFTTVQGRHILKLLARTATSAGGRISLVLAARALALAARVDNAIGRRNTFMDQLSTSLLRRVRIDRDDPVWRFLREVSEDQGVILQVTPESLDLFNALASDRPGVFYGCVATAAPPPPFHFGTDVLIVPERALLAGVFVAVHTLNRWSHGQYPYPEPNEATRELLRRDLGFEVTDQTSDGIVPTFSQLHGKLLFAVLADHLDVVGQFHRKEEPLSDWLPSGSGFDQARFDTLWSAIAGEIVRVRTS